MELFRDGTDLTQLPFLEAFFAKLAFVVVVERWVESRHAISRRIFANCPRATALHLAYHIVVPRVKAIIGKSGAEAFQDLAMRCRQVRSASRALAAFGLSNHPTAQAALAAAGSKRGLNREGRARVVEVFFFVYGVAQKLFVL